MSRIDALDLKVLAHIDGVDLVNEKLEEAILALGALQRAIQDISVELEVE